MGLENNCFIFAMRDDIRCTVQVARVVIVAFDIYCGEPSLGYYYYEIGK